MPKITPVIGYHHTPLTAKLWYERKTRKLENPGVRLLIRCTGIHQMSTIYTIYSNESQPW